MKRTVLVCPQEERALAQAGRRAFDHLGIFVVAKEHHGRLRWAEVRSPPPLRASSSMLRRDSKPAMVVVFAAELVPCPSIRSHGLGQAKLHRQSFAIVGFLHNCLAFPAVRSDPCDDREERGKKGDSK
jgi:hypothetical protein